MAFLLGESRNEEASEPGCESGEDAILFWDILGYMFSYVLGRACDAILGHDCNECFLHHQNMDVRVHAITSTRRLLPSFQMHEQRRYNFVL
jgi:hypothetical protein